MTKREYFEKIKTYVENYPEYVEFINGEIARLDARANKVKAKRAEKAGEEGDAIKAKAIEILADAGRAITLAELAGGMGEFTTGKIVYHVGKLVDEGKIVKEKAKVGDRKIMTYKIAE